MLKHKPQAVCGHDRRQFGRRTLLWHAWIVTCNRQRIACSIRNVSAGGALLELSDPVALPPKFDLVIEDRDLSIRCDLRHCSELSVGLAFADIDKGHALFELSESQPHSKQAMPVKHAPAEPKVEQATVAASRPRLSPEVIAAALRMPA